MADKPRRAGAARPRSPELQLRLYIAGQSPRSIAAVANLKRICDIHLDGRYAIEVIDVIEQPHLAKADEIRALPTLVKRLPQPIRKVIGDLSDADRVLLGVDIVKRGRRVSSDGGDIDDVAISHDEAVETLRAIRSGRIDAVVVNGANGRSVATLGDPDLAYRALIEAMGDGAALVTRDGLIRYHNPRFAELMLRSRGDPAAQPPDVGSGAMPLRGLALRGLVPARAAASIDGMLERARRGPSRIEVSIASSSGTTPVQLTASSTSVGDVDVLCVVATDLGEQRAQAELYREALVGMEARERLLSIAGHELRAPVQVLVSEIAALLAQHPATAVAQLESIRRLGVRIADLVGTLLDVRLLGSDELALSTEDLDLAEVVQTVVARSDELVRSGSPVALEARSIRGRWDRLRLEQVVTNLLSNAGKYGMGKPIRVAVDGDDAIARLVVEDRGIGVPRDAIDRLFRPFERIGSVNTATGLGLGLYITAQIVKAHGGVVKVESDLGVGSRFVVELPYGR
jgi:signal transduction histidine kinase